MRRKSELSFEEAVFADSERNDLDYIELPTSRTIFFFVAGTAALVVLLVIVQIGVLNVFKGAFYEARAGANITREIDLPAYRAVIADRNGEVLAKNTSSFSVFLNIPFLYSDEGGVERILSSLSDILKIDKQELFDLVKAVDLERSNWVAIARNITANEAIAIGGLNEKALQIVDDYEREYADAPAFAHVIGYTGSAERNEIVGKSGLEMEYDDSIKGANGSYVFYEDAVGNVLGEKTVSPPKPGAPLELTIDAGLQRYFYKRLKNGLESLGRNAGAGIALNPKTGEILALVSLPSFDSNIFVDRKMSVERENILKNKLKPIFNRAISGFYSPGSTIKPLVALSALKEKVIGPSDKIYSSGALSIPNPYNPEHPSVFLDWKAHGWVDLRSAIARSSNIYFYLLGGGLPKGIPASELVSGNFNLSGLGINRLRNYWQKFGFGKESGIDLPAESDGFLPNAEEKEKRTGTPWRLGDTYNVTIGQGDLLVTPLQLINFMASIANGGKIYRPFINKKLPPEILIDYSDWRDEVNEVRKGLEDAVKTPSGSSHVLNTLQMHVAGKTGTPQIENKAKTNAFFVGYGPTDDPEIAVLVLIEEAKEGSLNALPVAKDVFEWYYNNRMQGVNVR